MTDSRLLQLKRAWEASGSVSDEASYLRERLRVGELTQGRLELAAGCGYPGAIEATGVPRWTLNSIPVRVHGLEPNLQLRLLLALSRTTFRVRLQRSNQGNRPFDLAIQLAACEQLCLDREASQVREVIEAVRLRLPEGGLHEYDSALWGTLMFALDRGPLPLSLFGGQAGPSATLPALLNRHVRLSEECWRLFLAWDLVPFCLGWFDPLRDRVAVRGVLDPARFPAHEFPALVCEPRHLLSAWNRCQAFDQLISRGLDPSDREAQRRREVAVTLASEAVLLFSNEITLPLAEWLTEVVQTSVPSFEAANKAREAFRRI